MTQRNHLVPSSRGGISHSLGLGPRSRLTPSASIAAHLAEHKLVQTCALSALSDTRLGIDLSHYLSTLLNSPSTREPLVATTGGLPLSLTANVEADLRALEKLRIKPVFVCSGLPLASRPPTRGGVDTPRESALRAQAWEHYEAGRVDEAVRLLEGTTPVHQRDLMRVVLRIFRHRQVEFLIAPYTSAAQVRRSLRRLERAQASFALNVANPRYFTARLSPQTPQGLHSFHLRPARAPPLRQRGRQAHPFTRPRWLDYHLCRQAPAAHVARSPVRGSVPRPWVARWLRAHAGLPSVPSGSGSAATRHGDQAG